MRPRISIRGCVHLSVSWSVGRLVCNAFVKITENGIMQDGDASYVMYMALFSCINIKLCKSGNNEKYKDSLFTKSLARNLFLRGMTVSTEMVAVGAAIIESSSPVTSWSIVDEALEHVSSWLPGWINGI